VSIIVAFHFYFNIQIEDKEFGYLIYTISDIQKLCTPIFLEWKIKKAFLFGSYARNEATETSDLDILIDGEGSLLQNIFDVIRLKSKLSSALKKRDRPYYTTCNQRRNKPKKKPTSQRKYRSRLCNDL
jgi:predicted nucleotidyltransferase